MKLTEPYFSILCRNKICCRHCLVTKSEFRRLRLTPVTSHPKWRDRPRFNSSRRKPGIVLVF